MEKDLKCEKGGKRKGRRRRGKMESEKGEGKARIRKREKYLGKEY